MEKGKLVNKCKCGHVFNSNEFQINIETVSSSTVLPGGEQAQETEPMCNVCTKKWCEAFLRK